MTRLQDKDNAADLETGQRRSAFIQEADREKKLKYSSGVRRGLARAAAAGMTGILFAGGAVQPAAAAESANPVSSREDGEDWEQQALEALQRWGVEEGKLPPEEEEEQIPDVPDDLRPFFEEWTEEAAASYGNALPPRKDLRKYSRRADALRKLVRDAAKESLQRKSGQIRETLMELAQSAGEESLPMLVRALQEKKTEAVSVSFRVGAQDSSAGESGRTDARLPLGQKDPGSGAKSAGSPINRFLKNTGQEESLPEESLEDQNFFEAISMQYAPGDWEKLPVPPGLYDFSIRFPAQPWKMMTRGGQTLFPGLTGYAQIIDEDAHRTEAARLAGYRKEVLRKEVLRKEKLREEALREEVLREEALREEALRGETLPKEGTEENREKQAEELSAVSQEGQASASSEEGKTGAEFFGSGYDPLVPGLPPLENLISPDPAVSSTWISRLAAGAGGEGRKEEPSRRLVLVGDSRTVGMEMYVQTEGDVYWSAANSMGYSWMVQTGVPAVEKQIQENTDVVFLMGVNDLGNVSRYIDYMNEKAAEWKKRGARTFFVSVNPVDDRRSPNAKNSRIESFNAYAQENLKGVCYIDAYSRIRSSFGSPDGIHFDAGTYREIFRIIRFYVYRGWYETNGLRFYFSGGKPLTGWQFLDGRWQYFDGNGVRWIRNGWAGDVCIAPYPETGMLDPFDAVRHH